MKILLFVFALCAFMYMAPSDGMDVIRYYGKKGTICKQGNHWIVKINCKNTCRITKPKAAFKKGGRVHIQGRQGQVFRQKRKSCGVNCFCTKRSKQRWNHVFCMNHKGKKIKKSSVYFDIWCVKKTTNLRFRAQIKNLKHKMTVKKCPTGENRHQDGVCRECATGEWKNGLACDACGCDNDLATYKSCDTSGKCFCKDNAKGNKCDSCKDQFFKATGTKVCSACGCNNAGTTNDGKCGADGVCTCDTTNYKGSKCEQCQDPLKNKHQDGVCRKCDSGQYDLTGTCTPCACDANGAKFQSCETSTGVCKCNDGYKDPKCDQCADKFYKKTGTQVCSACECDKDGAGDSFKCAVGTGECTCNPNFKLPKCKECKDQFYFKTSSKTCEACTCDPDGAKNLKCAKGTGNCECKAEAKGPKCVACSADDHYRPAGGGACRACNCVTANTIGGKDVTCDRTGKCNCQTGKTANDCSS